MSGTQRINGPNISSTGAQRLYFTPFRPLSHPGNARNTVEKSLFYMSAGKFDVFNFFNNFIALKPAIIERSGDLIAERLGKRPDILIKEAAAGTGESLKILLEGIRRGHPEVYEKVVAVASDGYPAVVESMRSSAMLQPLILGGKLSVALEDILSPLRSSAMADYVRLSCMLCELPEDTVRVEGGKLSVAYVRGYIEGRHDFDVPGSGPVSAEDAKMMLQEGALGALIEVGLLPPLLNPRIKYEVMWRPFYPAMYGKDANAVQYALNRICRGIRSAEFKLGLSAARAAENLLKYHLKDERGSYAELFDSWTAGIYEGMPCAILDYGLTTVTHPNYPFLAEYLAAKGHKVTTSFDNWYEYTDRTEPYIYVHPFYKWLKSADRASFAAFFGRDIWGDDFDTKKKQLVDHLCSTQLKYEDVLSSEKDHIFIRFLMDHCNFTQRDVSRLFDSKLFLEMDRSRTEGFYGNYQVVTVAKE